MGKKNKRKNCVAKPSGTSAKASTATKSIGISSPEVSLPAGADRLLGNVDDVLNRLRYNAVDPRYQELEVEDFQQRIPKILVKDGRMQGVTQQQPNNQYYQQQLQIQSVQQQYNGSNQLAHPQHQYQMRSNHHQANMLGAIDQKGQTNYQPMIRRMDRKVISQSWDGIITNMGYSQIPCEDEDEEDYDEFLNLPAAQFQGQSPMECCGSAQYHQQHSQQQHRFQATIFHHQQQNELNMKEMTLQSLCTSLMAQSKNPQEYAEIVYAVAARRVKVAQYEDEDDEEDEEQEGQHTAETSLKLDKTHAATLNAQGVLNQRALQSYSQKIFIQGYQGMQTAGAGDDEDFVKGDDGEEGCHCVGEDEGDDEEGGEEEDDEYEDNEEAVLQYTEQMRQAYNHHALRLQSISGQPQYAYQEDQIADKFVLLQQQQKQNYDRNMLAQAQQLKRSQLAGENQWYQNMQSQTINPQLQQKIGMIQKQEQQYTDGGKSSAKQQQQKQLYLQQNQSQAQLQKRVIVQQQQQQAVSYHFEEEEEQRERQQLLALQQLQQQQLNLQQQQQLQKAQKNLGAAQAQPKQPIANGNSGRGCITPSTDDNSECTSSFCNHLKDEFLDLEQILSKIYFEKYRYDEIKEFIYPALRKVENINNFFDILFNSIREYAEGVKSQIQEQLLKIIATCRPDLLDPTKPHQFTKIPEIQDFEEIIATHFRELAQNFLNITSSIYDKYYAVEDFSRQTEKIVHIYIYNFIEKNRSIRFNCTELHKRIFVFFVFNDQMINNYLEAKINFFKSKVINSTQYNECLSKLREIHNILVKKSQFIPSEEHPINIEIYESSEEDGGTDDERYGQQLPPTQSTSSSSLAQPTTVLQQQQQATINQKLLKKRNQKKNKNHFKKLGLSGQSVQPSSASHMINTYNGDPLDLPDQSEAFFDQMSPPVYSIEAQKKKKKKKKSKTTAATGAGTIANSEEGCNQIDEDILSFQQSSAEKPKKGGDGKKKGAPCPANDEIEQFALRLEESNKNLKEHQKIQPIINESWIQKVKERYSKMKINLNK